jgi:hypothetical protein
LYSLLFLLFFLHGLMPILLSHVQDCFPFFATKCYLHHLRIINFFSPFTRCFALWSLLEFHHLWIIKNDWYHWRVIEIDPNNFFYNFLHSWTLNPKWNWSPLSIIINDLQLVGKLKVIYIITSPPKEIDSQFLFFFNKIGRVFFAKGISLGQRWWQIL